MNRWDVIVVGGGAVGSAALRAASESGARALCLELHSPAHSRGSSHGHSRIFRHSYFELPDYVPLLRHSTGRFESLERESKTSLLNRCGMLAMGPPDSEIVLGCIESARRWSLPVDALDAASLRGRFPWFSVSDDAIGAFEADAGIVRPEATVDASIRVARSLGAELRIGWRVLGLLEDTGGVTVQTDHGNARADAVIVAAGGWTSQLLPELAPLLTVTRQVQAWFAPVPGVDASAMPCWIFDRGQDRRSVYGLAPDPAAPSDAGGTPTPSRHPKLGLHGSGDIVNPDTGAAPVDDSDIERIRSAYREIAPSLAGDLAGCATCLYTMSPDGQFLVGTRRGSRRIHFAAGLSGHGFKLSPALGDALAQLATTGRTGLPIGFLAPGRFAQA
ncbi:MAG: N-methyl-L-tryptophan oxidase [Steroidobacteraceae bacterium]|nr:N-methyl-L-tryptophan oxidase [Steroidobacteraceae bacterium]